jgi:hypothetical protein
MTAILSKAAAAGCVLFAAGCTGLLPTADEQVESRWASYAETSQAFERIVPGDTTVAELTPLGFDPFDNPNVRILNYLDVIQRFVPNASIRLADLDPAVRTCLKATTACRAYEVSPRSLHKERHGNVLLDVFNFRRDTTTEGWSFDGLIVLNGDRVVYKLSGGQPSVAERERRKNPLGPFQDISANTGVSLQ